MINWIIAMAPQGGDAGGGGIASTLIMFGVIFVIFYFMILRPQQKRQKEHAKMLESIKKGDKVLMNSGIHARVVNVEEKTMLVEVADGVKIKVERSAVTSVTRESTEG